MIRIFLLILVGFLFQRTHAQNTLVSNGSFFEGEPSLAINPNNPQHLIAAWMGFQFNQKIVIKSSVSWNGGTSWTASIFQSHESAGNSSADVSLGFDPQGNAYMCYIDYDNVGFSEGKVVVRKSTDGGSTWSTMQRVNQDPIGNNRIQDLVWGDLNEQGNLVITWRDRRNAPGDGYNQPSEVYAATKAYGASGFTQDYPITSQGIPHDTILEASGNDFMSVVYVGDSCYAVWGDVRSGTLKIYLNKWHVGNPQNNLFLIGEEFSFNVYPNPSSDKLTINLPFEGPFSIHIFDEMGKLVFDEPSFSGNTIDIAKFKGTYTLEIFYQGKTYSTKFKAAK